MTEPDQITITGIASSNKAATPTFLILSGFCDVICIFSLGILVLHFLNVLPIEVTKAIFVLSALAVIYWLSQKALFGVTVGERIWHLKVKEGRELREFLNNPLYQRDHLTRFELISSALATLSFCMVSFLEFHQTFLKHPILMEVSLWTLNASIPRIPSLRENAFSLNSISADLSNPADAASSDIGTNLVVPFFYHIGFWPTIFHGKPVYYSLAYEIGPPKRFVGKIVAHLQDPDIQLTLEGPKTPEHAISQAEIKSCFLHRRFDSNCISSRHRALSRHLEDVQNQRARNCNAVWPAPCPVEYKIQWFQVRNSSLNEEDQAQGIYLQASGSSKFGPWAQDRFILISSNGAHQTIILDRPETQEGQQAFATTLQALRTLRNFRDLDAGRAWIDRALQSIQLEKLRSIQNPLEFTGKVAMIQRLLLSKISVDPGNFEPYYHLAGTSLLIATQAQLKNEPLASTRPEIVTSLANLRSAYSFAKDITPNEPRILQMENMLSEAKNAFGQSSH